MFLQLNNYRTIDNTFVATLFNLISQNSNLMFF